MMKKQPSLREEKKKLDASGNTAEPSLAKLTRKVMGGKYKKVSKGNWVNKGEGMLRGS